MVDKIKEWSSPMNWLMLLIRAVIILLISFGMQQYFALAKEVRAIKTDVAVMKGNRFTSADGALQDKRITILEEKMINLVDDVKEIKQDVKEILRKK